MTIATKNKKTNIVRAAEMPNEELGRYIRAETIGLLRRVNELRPFFDELWQRFSRLGGGQTICGCKTRTEYCERVLHRSMRSVQYILYGREASDPSIARGDRAAAKDWQRYFGTDIEVQPAGEGRFNLVQYGLNESQLMFESQRKASSVHEPKSAADVINGLTNRVRQLQQTIAIRILERRDEWQNTCPREFSELERAVQQFTESIRDSGVNAGR